MGREPIAPELLRVDENEADRLVRQAVQDVDQSLLDWALKLSPRERLRASTKTAVALGKFRRGASQG